MKKETKEKLLPQKIEQPKNKQTPKTKNKQAPKQEQSRTLKILTGQRFVNI